jgi:hypothetical protein
MVGEIPPAPLFQREEIAGFSWGKGRGTPAAGAPGLTGATPSR